MLKREKLYKNFVHDRRSSENNSTEKLVGVIASINNSNFDNEKNGLDNSNPPRNESFL